MKKAWCLRFADDKVDSDIKDEHDSLHGSNCASLIHKAAPEADIYVAKKFKFKEECVLIANVHKTGKKVISSFGES